MPVLKRRLVLVVSIYRQGWATQGYADRTKAYEHTTSSTHKKVQLGKEQKQEQVMTVPQQVREMCGFVNDKHSKLYCNFLSSVRPIFDEGNLLLQRVRASYCDLYFVIRFPSILDGSLPDN